MSDRIDTTGYFGSRHRLSSTKERFTLFRFRWRAARSTLVYRSWRFETGNCVMHFTLLRATMERFTAQETGARSLHPAAQTAI